MPAINNPGANIRTQIYNVYGHWSRSIKTSDGFKLIVYNVKGVLTTQLFDLFVDEVFMNLVSNAGKTFLNQNRIIGVVCYNFNKKQSDSKKQTVFPFWDKLTNYKKSTKK